MEQGIQRKLILGTSGAIVLRGERATLKAHPGHAGLLLAQAAYMREYGAPFARVLRIGAEGYATPTLRPLFGPMRDRLVMAVASLASLWSQPASVPATWAAEHWAYVTQLCTLHRLPWVQHTLYRVLPRVLRNPGPVCVTHGDATLDNMLLDEHNRATWVDPIPPTPKVPAFLAVDIGKLLQSAYGYEHIKYGRRWPETTERDMHVVLRGLSAPVRFAAHYWYWVHMLRLLRYALPHVKAHYTTILNGESIFD